MPGWFGPPAGGPSGDAQAEVGPLASSLLGRARAAGMIDVRVHDLRAWATDRHRTVDDMPYGGEERLRLEHHAGTAAVGHVVHSAVAVRGPGTQVVHAHVDHPGSAGPAQQ